MITINKKCCICGREIRSRKGKSSDIVLCSICKNKSSKAKHENMINSAVRRYEKIKFMFSDGEINKLKEIILSKENIERKYDSKDEVVFALSLAYDEIEFEIQKEICGHKVDFYIPSLSIIVEIDGELYHKNREKDLKIDEDIKNYLGSDFEILRIPCCDVNNFVVIGAENHILAKLEEKEYLKNHSFDINDKFWSNAEFARRNGLDSKTIS